MTCLSCEKCHSHDFEQLTPFYDKDGLKQVFKCKNCGKTFLLPARISVEKRPLGFSNPEVSRVIIEKPCCPFCECIEIEEVEG
jgi:transposase-like protein